MEMRGMQVSFPSVLVSLIQRRVSEVDGMETLETPRSVKMACRMRIHYRPQVYPNPFPSYQNEYPGAYLTLPLSLRYPSIGFASILFLQVFSGAILF